MREGKTWRSRKTYLKYQPVQIKNHSMHIFVHKKVRDQAYNEYVESVTPKHNLAANMAKAFVMGGIICCIGQLILNTCKSLGLDKEMSGSWCSILLILLSVILTGLNLYPSLANWGGAGSQGLQMVLQHRRLNFRKRDRFLESAVRYLQSQDLLFCMVFFQAGFWDLFTGCSVVWHCYEISGMLQ